MVSFHHSVLAGLQICVGDLQPCLNILIYQRSLEAVDGDARLGQRILRLILAQASLAHLHAGRFRYAQGLVCVLDGAVQVGQVVEDVRPCSIAMVARRMTPHANTGWPRAEHRVRWKLDAMVAVANYASRKALILKSLAVRALRVHLCLEGVTGRTHILNLIDSRRLRAMISMTGCASRRAQVTAYHHRVVVDA